MLWGKAVPLESWHVRSGAHEGNYSVERCFFVGHFRMLTDFPGADQLCIKSRKKIPDRYREGL